MATAGLNIPPCLPGDINEWTEDHVTLFLTENERAYQLKNDDIQALKMNGVDGVVLFDLTKKDLLEMGFKHGPAMKFILLFSALKSKYLLPLATIVVYNVSC